jgi:GNAT superfamily N-acetyltransferase
VQQFHIREARFPKDEPTALRFIEALQRHELEVEADRRKDLAFAGEFLAVQQRRTRERNGCIFIAEDESGTPLGWTVAYEEEAEIFVVAGERLYGYIAELYVDETARGKGVGRALMSACEDWAHGRGLKCIMVGALAANDVALSAYRATGYAPYITLLRKYL